MEFSKGILAIIPARAGSKGIKNKNIIPIAGKPLINWTIEAALESKYITRTVVSTNSHKIKKIAKEAGAEVPFLRPKRLSHDEVGNEPVVNHCLDFLYDKENQLPELIVYLPPTSPLRNSSEIDAAIEKYERCMYDSIISVTFCNEHPYWTKHITELGFLEDFIPLRKSEQRNYYRRQNLPKAYILNGAIYISSVKEFSKSGSFYSGLVGTHIMPREKSIDINEELDLKIAELLLKERKK